MSTTPDQEWQDQLQASLRRAQEAISRGVTQQDQMVQEWTVGLRNAYPDWGRERWQRRLERKLRKRAEREARIANASLFEGYMWMLGAIVLFIVALSTMPFGLFLLFPALSLGTRGTRVIARHANGGQPVSAPGMPLSPASPVGLGASAPQQPVRAGQSAQEAQARERAQRFGGLDPSGMPRSPLAGLRDVIDGGNLRGAFGGAVAPARGAPPAADPRDQRVDAICDKILAELRDSPEAVRDIFRKPEETVAALRATCRDLSRRERDVRRFLAPEEDARLERERKVLQQRVDAESDEVTKLRLASALAALDQQRAQRVDLARSAARFDAEHMRISYTLESLYTQVVRMRSADAGSVDVAGAGLRRSLDLLSHEVNALADALEKVNEGTDERARLSRVAEGPGSPPAEPSPGAPAAREKA